MIRKVLLNEREEVDQVITEAFTTNEHGYGEEAELVEALRQEESYRPELDCLAIEDDRVVGHAFLSEIHIVDDVNHKESLGLALAPISVLPSYQGKGIGHQLMENMEEQAKKLGYSFITILGDPGYYHTFGYQEAKKYGIRCAFEVPEEYYMVKEILPGGLAQVEGTVRYSAAFG